MQQLQYTKKSRCYNHIANIGTITGIYISAILSIWEFHIFTFVGVLICDLVVHPNRILESENLKIMGDSEMLELHHVLFSPVELKSANIHSICLAQLSTSRNVKS
jgi:hypothetical protein